MREFRTSGSVRGAPRNGRPYRDWDAERVTVHPLRDTATMSLTAARLRAVLADLGVEPIVLDL